MSMADRIKENAEQKKMERHPNNDYVTHLIMLLSR